MKIQFRVRNHSTASPGSAVHDLKPLHPESQMSNPKNEGLIKFWDYMIIY